MGLLPRPLPRFLSPTCPPRPLSSSGCCTFQVDPHDGLLRNAIIDVDDAGGVNDGRHALAGSPHALLIENVAFQQGQPDLALELCVDTIRSLEGFPDLGFPDKGGILPRFPRTGRLGGR